MMLRSTILALIEEFLYLHEGKIFNRLTLKNYAMERKLDELKLTEESLQYLDCTASPQTKNYPFKPDARHFVTTQKCMIFAFDEKNSLQSSPHVKVRG